MSSTPNLSEADARVLDALAEEGFDPSRIEELPAADRARAEAIVRMLGRLDRMPTEVPSDSLVPQLMDRVKQLEAERRERMRIEPAAPIRRRIRIPDVVTIAASLLLALGVGWPVLSAVRGASFREQCERNLASIGTGLAAYSHDHRDSIPLAAGLGSFLSGDAPTAKSPAAGASNWPDWRTYRHSAALGRLAEASYVGSRCLTCPGCEKDRAALALRVPAAGQRFTLASLKGMLVSDANPAIETLLDGGDWRSASRDCSSNHAARGQNVLFDDGSVRWLVSPLLPGGDCIWTPSGRNGETLSPGSLPLDPDDCFLAQ